MASSPARWARLVSSMRVHISSTNPCACAHCDTTVCGCNPAHPCGVRCISVHKCRCASACAPMLSSHIRRLSFCHRLLCLARGVQLGKQGAGIGFDLPYGSACIPHADVLCGHLLNML